MLNGPYDFNRTPIAPLGTKCLVHEKPAIRGTWTPHTVDGWYVGPDQDHYRCYMVYIPITKGTRQSETVEFFPYRVTMPATFTADLVVETAKDLTHLLQNPAPASPFEKFGTETIQALATLADIFSQLKPKIPVVHSPQQPPPPVATPSLKVNPVVVVMPSPRVVPIHRSLPNTPAVSQQRLGRAVSPESAPKGAASHSECRCAAAVGDTTPANARGANAIVQSPSHRRHR